MTLSSANPIENQNPNVKFCVPIIPIITGGKNMVSKDTYINNNRNQIHYLSSCNNHVPKKTPKIAFPINSHLFGAPQLTILGLP